MIQLRGPVAVAKPVRVEIPVNPSETSHVEIDVGRVQRNVGAIREMLRGRGSRQLSGAVKIGGPLICAVVKKNAYGLGAVQLAPRLVKAGCDMLAVYTPAEAEELVLKAAITCPILVMLPLRQLSRNEPLYRSAVAEKLHLAVHDREQLAQVNTLGQTFGIKWPVHLYLDTGMSRSGLNYDQFSGLCADMLHYQHVRVAGVYSHFASGDSDPEYTEAQFNAFEESVQNHEGYLPVDLIRHVAATTGMLRDRRYHCEMVRPGLGLYGYGPESLAPGPVIAEAPVLEHAVRWLSQVIHVQRYPRWSAVGYGSTHKLKRESVLGIVPVGYGDGYPLALSNQGIVRVYPKDERLGVLCARVLGRVNMDQIVIDLTELVVEDTSQLLGAQVELIGNDPEAENALPKLAAMAGSSCYEMLCRLGPNVPRRYINGHER